MEPESWQWSSVWSGSSWESGEVFLRDFCYSRGGPSIKTVFGVVSQPTVTSAGFFSEMLANQPGCLLRLVASVVPVCATKVSDLDAFEAIQSTKNGRAEFRIFPEYSMQTMATSFLCMIDQNDCVRVVVGSCLDLGLVNLSPTQLQVSTIIPPDLVEMLSREFDRLWSCSGSLNKDLIEKFPSLVLPEGSYAAAELWEKFQRECIASQAPAEPISEGVQAELVPVERINSITSTIGVKRMAPVERHLVALFRMGRIPIFDASSRLKPIDVPLKPEWFNVDRKFSAGAIRSTTSMRISPFLDEEFKRLEAHRCEVSDLIAAYSFSLGNRVRWMPDRARPAFEEAIRHLGKRWKTVTLEIVGGNPYQFLNSRQDKIQADAQQAYSRYHPGERIPKSSLNSIEAEIDKRLHRMINTDFEPVISFTPLQYELADSNGKGGSLSLACSLLSDMVRFQREAIVRTPSWMQRTSAVASRDLRADTPQPSPAATREALMETMDLLGDHSRATNTGKDWQKSNAQRDLQCLNEMEEESKPDLEYCTTLFEMIVGCSIPEYEDRLERRAYESMEQGNQVPPL
ncbi:MAG: hypothetical protein IPK50_13830 [Fibrobacterota bacterium]|nr:MAG: hypothetical protein IPK50_13830 [Fibrobacterota bacterium]